MPRGSACLAKISGGESYHLDSILRDTPQVPTHCIFTDQVNRKYFFFQREQEFQHKKTPNETVMQY